MVRKLPGAWRMVALAVVVASTLGACSGPTEQGMPTPSPSRSGTPFPSPSPRPTVAATPTPTTSPDCVAGAGRSVKELPDVVVAAVEVPPVTMTDEVGKTTTVIDGFTIPAQLVDAGCVITYDAPGGCLGAVRITGATIPPATIPESVLPAAEVPGDDGDEVAEKVFGSVTVPGISAPPAFTPKACQLEDDGVLPSVTREGVVRRGVARNGTARPGGSRGRECGSSGCVPEVRVATVRIPPVRLPDVDIDPGRLESRKLAGQRDVDVLTGDGKVSYVAPGAVLFDTDQATIRSDAAMALRDIADQIKAKHPNARLRVEGHTDDRGDEAYGVRLSERRAKAVATWFVNEAGFPTGNLTTKGFGETAPAVPNTSDANRQKNRRVVITVLDS